MTCGLFDHRVFVNEQGLTWALEEVKLMQADGKTSAGPDKGLEKVSLESFISEVIETE